MPSVNSLKNLITIEKGRSGNPKGRPKGSKSLAGTLRDMLERKLTYKDPKTGEAQLKTTREILLLKLLEKAIINGETKAIAEVLDRVDGKAIATNVNITEGESHEQWVDRLKNRITND